MPWVTLSLISLLVAAVAWTVGDALIVGFAKPDRHKHAHLISLMGNDSYAYQLGAGEPRLRWGALIGDYTAPLMLAGLYAHGVAVQNSAIGISGVVLMGIGMAYSPLAHAAFYHHGLASQQVDRDLREGADTARSAALARNFHRFLTLAWVPAVAFTAIGGLLFMIPLAAGWTPLPRWAICFCPPLLLPAFSLLKRLPYPGKPLLEGAGMNIALTGWTVAFLTLHLTAYPIG